MNLDNVAIVLVRPQISENIGSAARAMHNMGISRLIIVAPKDCELSRVLKTATGTSIDIIEAMEVHDELHAALAPFHYIIGTTARIGSHRPAMSTPRSLAQEVARLSRNNLVAIVFGPEDRGLSNDELTFCHKIATIPTALFSSLNLAHAVMIVCYELFQAADAPLPPQAPRLASSFELEGMYDHLSQVLMKIGFINPQNPQHWMRNVRRFFSRIELRAREVRIVRGICRQIDWYTGQFEKTPLKKQKE
jgi:tRNA/rRNA methyltransferase